MVSEEAEERNRRVATGGSAEDENAVRGAACAGKEADKGAPPPVTSCDLPESIGLVLIVVLLVGT